MLMYNHLWAILGHATEFLNYGVVLADAEQNIIQINSHAQRLLGFSQPPKTVEEFTAALPEHTKFINHVNNCSHQGLTCDFRHLDVNSGSVRVYLTPIIDGTDFIGNLISVQDVSSSATQDTNRNQFLAALVHELRTPLTAIRGSTSILEEDYQELIAKDEDVKKLVEMIRSGSENVLEMVNQFLDMSKLEENRITFDLQVFTLGELLKATVESLDVLAKQRQLSLTTEDSPALAQVVVGDPGRVRQVLTNLIGNALKFTPQGGVTLRAAIQDSTVEVSVTDTGAGIPDAERGGLFQKYFQTSNNELKNNSAKSTGLGLYITKLIVEAMGGQVYLKDSVQGQGSTFAFTLDLATEERRKLLEQQVTDAQQGVHHKPLEKKETVKIA